MQIFFFVRARSLGCWESLLVYHAPPLPQRLANRGVDSLEAFPGRIDVAEAARHRGGERRCRGGRAQRQILWGHRLLLLLLYPGHIHRGGGRTAMQRHHLAIAGGLSVAADSGSGRSGGQLMVVAPLRSKSPVGRPILWGVGVSVDGG